MSAQCTVALVSIQRIVAKVESGSVEFPWPQKSRKPWRWPTLSKNFRKEGQPEKERVAQITGLEVEKVRQIIQSTSHWLIHCAGSYSLVTTCAQGCNKVVTAYITHVKFISYFGVYGQVFITYKWWLSFTLLNGTGRGSGQSIITPTCMEDKVVIALTPSHNSPTLLSHLTVALSILPS